MGNVIPVTGHLPHGRGSVQKNRCTPSGQGRHNTETRNQAAAEPPNLQLRNFIAPGEAWERGTPPIEPLEEETIRKGTRQVIKPARQSLANSRKRALPV